MKGEKKIKVGFNKIVFTSTITIIALLIAVCNCYAASTVIFKYDINNNQEIEEDDAIKILKHIVAKKTNKNKEWLIDEDINLNSFLDVLRYIEANNEENIKEKHKEWLSLKEEIILNVKSREENLNLTTNNEVKIQIDGKNYGEPKYESQNTSIAEVNKLGVITAKEKGSTIITVYDEKQLINETIRVNVNDDSETLKISKDNLILDISDYNTEKLEIEGNVQGTLIWSSSDDKIATVDQEGNVIGKSNGECSINAVSSKGSKVECKVVVQTSPTGIELEHEEVNLMVNGNKEYKIKGRIIPDTANVNKEVTYRSLDNEVAEVDQEGNIIAISEGSTSIEVITRNEKKAICRVNVIEEKAPTISITKLYNGNILTAGEEVSYEINIDADTIKSINNEKIKCIGTLANEVSGGISGSDKKYKLTLKVPEKIGTLGFVIEEGFITNNSDDINLETKFEEQNVFTLDTTTSNNSITTAIGVTNSFYIKDYDYYLNDEKKEEGRTTNEYTYSNLEYGKTYKVKVHINVYKDKETDETIEGWLEKEVRTEKNDGAEVHFINTTKGVSNSSAAGASDCTFIKTANGKTIMIDTGSENSGLGYENFVPSIDKYLRIDSNGKDGNALLKEENGVVNIDYLILTHGNVDSVGGFQDLTGVLYKQSSPGYMIDEENTINGTKIRYNFGKIILGCNWTKYDSNYKVEEIQDGAKGDETTEEAINKAIYCYAKDTNKVEFVNSGNTIKIDNGILNIYNPYPYEDVPKEWLSSVRNDINIYDSNGEIRQVNFSEANNNSIVIKLLCGSRKMLLMGDAEFIIEEMLLGIPSNQVKENDSSKNKGLKIDSSNGGNNDSEISNIDYMSLVNDLISNNYEECTTISELENRFKISRLTEKDLNAQVLKIGNHGECNATSIPFLNNVRPSKIVSTGESSNENYINSLIGCVNTGPDYCIRSYYDSDYSEAEEVEALNFSGGKIKLTQNNWYYLVFGTDNLSTTDGNDNGKGSFYILTEDGNNWNYSDPYEKIKGRATSQLSEFLKSWENVSMWKYQNGKINNYNSDAYIYMCITEDKKEYIMCDDLFTGNNNRNFGYGICFYVGGYGFINQSFYAAEGINIEDPKYQTYGVSKLPVDVVDRVKERIIEYQRNNVRSMASNRGITLTDYQVDAVAACAYQGWQMGGFLDAYKQYGMDESIRYQSTGMGTSNSRYRANWKLFSTGVYTDPDGNEISIR